MYFLSTEARSAAITQNKKVPEMAHSEPTNVPLVPGIDNVPRTPRTPHGTLLDRQDPRFYPVVKDGAKPDPQVLEIVMTLYPCVHSGAVVHRDLCVDSGAI